MATSTTYVAHNFMIFPDGLSGVCVMAGLLALFVRPDASTWRFAGLSVVTALLPWLHTRNAPVALVVGLAGAWPLLRARTWRSLAAWMTPLALSALGWLGFFKVIYGAFDPSAPYGGYTQSGLANLPRGLLGLLFDQQFGLLAVVAGADHGVCRCSLSSGRNQAKKPDCASPRICKDPSSGFGGLA